MTVSRLEKCIAPPVDHVELSRRFRSMTFRQQQRVKDRIADIDDPILKREAQKLVKTVWVA